ncbi:MAG: hypothetical protein ACI8RA_000721 [Chlamydiales bacterium]
MNRFFMGIAFVAVLSMSSCIKADPARSTKMFTFISGEKLGHFKESIHLARIGGGRDTQPFTKIPRVSNTDLKHAMTKSLEISNLLAKRDAKYHLTIRLLEESVIKCRGATVVTTNMQYQLLEKNSDDMIYDKQFSVFHVVPFKKAIFGPDRHRLALEGSVRLNIETFLLDLENVDPEARSE